MIIKLSMDAGKMLKEMEKPSSVDWAKYEGRVDPAIIAEVKGIYDTELAAATDFVESSTAFAEVESSVKSAFDGPEGLFALGTKQEKEAVASMEDIVEQMKKLEVDVASIKDVTIAEILEREPELRAKVEEEVKNNVWAP